jgi:hypothetical protein
MQTGSIGITLKCPGRPTRLSPQHAVSSKAVQANNSAGLQTLTSTFSVQRAPSSSSGAAQANCRHASRDQSARGMCCCWMSQCNGSQMNTFE